ncbi:hypothetical protein F7725_024824 [Dissostichus mawsoni]|uniref:Uncharacterized protein n=1 Tax=Dissostichus mawsoni TaxID=36200 RepID=A0A7J5X9D5_DISMA|nr:hypothetical protein F7725_024824 [Dissostichus mawsoni]
MLLTSGQKPLVMASPSMVWFTSLFMWAVQSAVLRFSRAWHLSISFTVSRVTNIRSCFSLSASHSDSDSSESSETQEDVYVASVETDRGVKEQLRLYDTKGLHDGQDLPKHYYSVADGFVLVYSVDSVESFKKVTVIVLGNKTDLRERRQVEPEAAQQWARGEKVKLWEVSVTERNSLIEPKPNRQKCHL